MAKYFHNFRLDRFTYNSHWIQIQKWGHWPSGQGNPVGGGRTRGAQISDPNVYGLNFRCPSTICGWALIIAALRNGKALTVLSCPYKVHFCVRSDFLVYTIGR
jgi:hypothetical protein